MTESKKVEVGDIIQVNEDGPPHWFRCLCIVDEVKSWGVQAYLTIPGARPETPDTGACDAFMRFVWREFDVVKTKSLFIAKVEPD